MRRAATEKHRPSVFIIVVVAIVVLLLIAAGLTAWQWRSADTSAKHAAAQELANFSTVCEQSSKDDADASHTVFGILSIERLGIRTPIVTGVDSTALSKGVGWYPTTGQPGQPGNFALAGYRFGGGEPFAHILDVKTDDIITVQTCSATYRYVVDTAPRELTVKSNADWVLDAVPGNPGRVPTESLLTLTANQDLFPLGKRAVAFARLQS